MLSVFFLINGESTISPEPQLQNLISTMVQKSSTSNQTFPVLQSKAVSSSSVDIGDANNSHSNSESKIWRQLRPSLVISHQNGQPQTHPTPWSLRPVSSIRKLQNDHAKRDSKFYSPTHLTDQESRAQRDGESWRRQVVDSDDLGLSMPCSLHPTTQPTKLVSFFVSSL